MTSTAHGPAAVTAFAAEVLPACEERLHRAASQGTPLVAEPADDTLSAGGKRLRPLLVFCCAPREFHTSDALIRAAAAVELVHMATLVHDDLLDGATLRRGRPTVASTRGASAAVQVGDFLFARAFSELAGAGMPAAVEVLAGAALDLSLGELAQQRAAFDFDLTEEAYLDRCGRKTASLFAASCRLGAMLGGADTATETALAEFGHAVGLAFQIFDDILDVTGSPSRTGKRRGADLRDGTVTLPVILALRHEPALAGRLASADTPEAIESCCEHLAGHAGTAEARERALAYVARARRQLDGPLDGADVAALVAIADGVVDRYA
jgi:geranylgeranyl pyrophosphate synthase